MCKAFITQNVTKWVQSTLQFCWLSDEVTAITNVSRHAFASRSQWKLLARASMSTHEYWESFALSCWAKGKWCPFNREACCSVLLAQNGSPEPLTSLAWKPHSSSTLSQFHSQQTIPGTWWSCQPPTYQPWWKTWSFLTLYLGGFCCWRLNNYKVNIWDIHCLFANVAQRLLLYLPLASARQAWFSISYRLNTLEISLLIKELIDNWTSNVTEFRIHSMSLSWAGICTPWEKDMIPAAEISTGLFSGKAVQVTESQNPLFIYIYIYVLVLI